MNRLITGAALILVTMPALASFYDAEQLDNLYLRESIGLRHYEAGDFAAAFQSLHQTAAQGLKQSQYVLGFMFMKGEGVDKNLLFGLAWVGLATEADNDDWQKTYDRLYNALSPAQKAMVDDKVDEYRRKFGAKEQGITCARAAVVGSRKQDIICRKSEGNYEDYEIELPIRQ